jgi:DNA-binding XRE family transcriptional regulator
MATVKITKVVQWPEEPLCLGERVRGLRKESGLTQVDAARGAGISYSAMKNIECSCYDPGWHIFGKIAKFYGVSLDWLAGIE